MRRLKFFTVESPFSAAMISNTWPVSSLSARRRRRARKAAPQLRRGRPMRTSGAVGALAAMGAVIVSVMVIGSLSFNRLNSAGFVTGSRVGVPAFGRKQRVADHPAQDLALGG